MHVEGYRAKQRIRGVRMHGVKGTEAKTEEERGVGCMVEGYRGKTEEKSSRMHGGRVQRAKQRRSRRGQDRGTFRDKKGPIVDHVVNHGLQ